MTDRRSTSAFDLVLTCEHATNRVPPEYARLFRGQNELLASHRGYDPGARELAEELRGATGAPLFASDATRLLVECNRSLHHKDLFSQFTRELDMETKQRIIADHYLPHRDRVLSAITQVNNRGRAALHVGVHSFTPNLDGVERQADIGILYDPTRPSEASFAKLWQMELERLWRDEYGTGEDRLTQSGRHAAGGAAQPAPFRVRRNYPYRGASDGMTTDFRRELPAGHYLGIELEVNNKHLTSANSVMRRRVTDILTRSLTRVLAI